MAWWNFKSARGCKVYTLLLQEINVWRNRLVPGASRGASEGISDMPALHLLGDFIANLVENDCVRLFTSIVQLVRLHPPTQVGEKLHLI